uniref:Uncharacterized protein n=1 Tax=Chrysotila carterae TaxID=13221 RepID=A0A7S4EU73_CHRCT
MEGKVRHTRLDVLTTPVEEPYISELKVASERTRMRKCTAMQRCVGGLEIRARRNLRRRFLEQEEERGIFQRSREKSQKALCQISQLHGFRQQKASMKERELSRWQSFGYCE